jgi:hypothetical protein
MRALSEGLMEVITYKWEIKLVKYNAVSDCSLTRVANEYYSEYITLYISSAPSTNLLSSV